MRTRKVAHRLVKEVIDPRTQAVRLWCRCRQWPANRQVFTSEASVREGYREHLRDVGVAGE